MSMTMGHSRFVDVIKLASMLKYKAIPNLRLVLHIEEEVEVALTGLEGKLKDGTSTYRAQVFYAKFDKDLMRNSVANAANRHNIDRMEDVHFINGECYVAIDNGLYKAYKNRYLVEAYGRLSEVGFSNCVFILAKWVNVGSKQAPTFKAAGVDISDRITCMSENPNDKIFFDKTIATKSFVQPEGISRGQRMGEIIDNPVLISSPPPPDYHIDSHESLGISEAAKKYGGIIAPVKPEGVPDVKTTLLGERPIGISDNGDRIIDINRAAFVDKSTELEEKYNDLDARLEEISEYAIEGVDNSDDEKNYIESFIELLTHTIAKYWFGKPGGTNCGMSGSVLFGKVLEEVLDEKDYKPIWDMYSYTTSIVESWGENDLSGALAPLESCRELILYRLLEKILGLSCNLYAVDWKCREFGRSVFDFIFDRPYKLSAITHISLKDMDKLAIISGNFGVAKSERDRAIAYYHWFLTDNSMMNGSTIMLEQTARLLKPGYYITKSEYLRLSGGDNASRGIYFDDNTRVNITSYLQIDPSALTLPKRGWLNGTNAQYNSMYLPIGDKSSYDDYLRSNLGVRIMMDKPYVSDFSIYQKELTIYHKLYSFYAPLPEIDVDEYIKRFELSQGKGFKLENRQKEAIRNCFRPENSVYTTTGGAGSGKTTLISGILYVFTNGYGYSDEDIIMVAPTGKAATQITEKTGYPAKTIHSAFKIGLPFSSEDFKWRVVIIDESSMINIDLMYDTLNRIPNDVRIIFSGDINQLEPIGFGQPFADSLNFTPIVTLNVMKRAEAGSTINRNAKRLTEGYEALDTGEDFKIINNPDYMHEVRKVIDDFLAKGNKLSDIQVISPVATDKYEWGTIKMNDYLQGLYNQATPKNTLKVARSNGGYTYFKVGDPVIHIENDYEKYHYNWVDQGSIKTLEQCGQGIRNGEIGHIVRVLSGNELAGAIAETDTTKEPLINEASRDKMLFLEVRFETPEGGYSLFYSARNKMRDNSINKDGWEVFGGNLNTIQLAYAITVHKMQGSQAPHIIILWYPMKNRTFLSRNMLYTACTRAQKTVTIIGDMGAIREARKIISSDKRTSYIKEYFKDKK